MKSVPVSCDSVAGELFRRIVRANYSAVGSVRMSSEWLSERTIVAKLKRNLGKSSPKMDKVGIVCVSILGFHIARSVLRFLYNKWLAPALKLNVNLREMGRWAVITGSTDGLGKAFAFACAKRGMDVVLISRDQKKLEKVASEIEAEHKVATKIIQTDFTDASPDNYYKIHTELVGLEIGVLINNVGMSYSHPEYFLDLPDKEKVFSNIIKCNIFSVTFMTQMILPQMVERNHGVVINIASTAAQIPSPLLLVYGASKAYVEKFSVDLANEYSKKGITVQCLVPGYVATKMSKIKRSTWMAPTPEQYVEAALSSTGIEPVTTGYFPHSLLVSSVHMLQAISSRAAVWVITHTMENIRSRALRHSSH